jgi:hypothetical protein
MVKHSRIGAIFILLTVFAVFGEESVSTGIGFGNQQSLKVIRVVDGDFLYLSIDGITGEKLRTGNDAIIYGE